MKANDLKGVYRCMAEIDRKALVNNLSTTRSLSNGADQIAMIKANGYGHGLIQIASILSEFSDVSFGVTDIDEAIIIRGAGIANDIYLFDGGASCGRSQLLIDMDITPVITEIKNVRSLEKRLSDHRSDKKKKIHIKIDTGFNRLGFDHSALLKGEYDALFRSVEESRFLDLDGIATHFYGADSLDWDSMERQIDIFERCIDHLDDLGIAFRCIHMANSAAIFRNSYSVSKNRETMVRPGLALYGIASHDGGEQDKLLPVLSIRAQIIAIRDVARGQGIGYGHSFCAEHDMVIAIVAIGYGDGIRRSLGNRGHFLLKGRRAPIVGRISMDSCAIDISEIIKELGRDAVTLGDQVTVLGQDQALSISVDMLAKLDGTIPYEILTSVSERITRRIV